MRGLLVVLLCVSLQGTHDQPCPVPLPALGERTLDVQVKERWVLRITAGEFRCDNVDWRWDARLRGSEFVLEKQARFGTQDRSIRAARACSIQRSYSEVRSRIELETNDRSLGRGALHGVSALSWATLRYRWNAEEGEYEVTSLTDGAGRDRADPLPGADEGLRAFCIDADAPSAGKPMNLERVIGHLRGSDLPVTSVIVDMDASAPAQQLALALSAAIDAVPRLEGLRGEVVEVENPGTQDVREYRLLLRSESAEDVSRQLESRMWPHPESADRLGFRFDTARIDANLRGPLRIAQKPGERFPSSVRMDCTVVLKLDLSGPFGMGGRIELHLSIEGTLERELRVRTE